MLTENITGNLDLSDAAVCPKGKNHSRGRGIAEALQPKQKTLSVSKTWEEERKREQKPERQTEKKIIYNKIDRSQADKNSSFP